MTPISAAPQIKLLSKVARLGVWSGAGQAIVTALAGLGGVSHPIACGAAAASILGVLAGLGYLPGPERKPHADLRRCFNSVGQLYFESMISEVERDELRKHCLAQFEQAFHGRN